MLANDKGPRSERGFTLVEVTIILLVLVILSTIMLPQLGNFNRLARVVVVYEDVGAICASLKKFLDEVMLPGPFGRPGGYLGTPSEPTGLLFGPGSIPAISGTLLSPAYNTASGVTNQIWNEAQDAEFNVQPDGAGGGGGAVTFYADNLNYHLQVNAPRPPNAGTVFDRYKTVIDHPAVGWFWGWRGPYFNEVNSDPWGTRYSVNTFGLHSGNSGDVDDVFWTAVICISFGPNKTANTEPNMPGDFVNPGVAPDYAIGGDDVAAILSAAGPF